MILGLILAVVSAVATNLAFLLKHRGAVVAPPIRARHPLRSAVGLFAERFFGFQLGRRQWVGVTITAAGLPAPMRATPDAS